MTSRSFLWLAIACGCYHGVSADGDASSSSTSGAATLTTTTTTSATTSVDSSSDDAPPPDLPPANQPPVAMFDATPTSGSATLAVMLDASASSDPDGTIVAYDWTLPDGDDEGVAISHDFTAVGCHDLELTVTDDDGATASANTMIVVAQGVAEVPAMATVDSSPLPSAVLPRDLDTDEGTASFHGTVASNGYTAVLAEVLVGETVMSMVSVPLCGVAPVEFDIDVPIPAELVAHDVRLSLVGGDAPQPIFTVTDLVAGDLYVIQGQSNAVAAAQNGDANENQSPFVRSFGSNTSDGNASATDVVWRMAEGNAGGGPAAIGQWGIRMAAQLSASAAIPIGVVNGGLGGQPISYFQRNDANTIDPATNYGRLLTRLRAAGIDRSLRAILWYQGENDGGAAQVHHDGFVALVQDWSEDYVGFERIYVTQIRAGCGGDIVDTKEAQRELGDEFPEISVMSTTALDGHDGCHYAYENGYRELGDRYAALLRRDLYDDVPMFDVAPPNPMGATLMAGNTQIVVTMRNAASTLTFADGAQTDFFVVGAPVTVTSGMAVDDTIVLMLSGDASTATAVQYYGHIGAGPWVTNEAGVGLLAFSIPLQGAALPQ